MHKQNLEGVPVLAWFSATQPSSWVQLNMLEPLQGTADDPMGLAEVGAELAGD